MTELKIEAHELSVLREMYRYFVHMHGTDSQEKDVVQFHRRLASEIARQWDSEQVLKSMLTDPDAEPLTVHLAHDDVKTYCDIPNNLSLSFLDDRHDNSLDWQLYCHWKEITRRWERQAREQES